MPGPASSGRVLALETNQNYTRLDPMLLPVSCERIKQILWREVGLKESWSGRIYITLHPAATGEDPITIGAERFRDGWQYGVNLPDVVDRLQYVRTIVRVLLLEAANRTAGEHSAEVPTWLSEGFARRLLASTNNEVEIILPPPRSATGGMFVSSRTVSGRRSDPLKDAHAWLRAASPLSFQDLSWPTSEQLDGQAGAVYGGSAQLFLSALLDLPDGPACLRKLLAELPRHFNWQLAFMDAFHSRFQRPLDVEKWWTLQWVHFTGHNLEQNWTEEESWEKLDELVRSTVQVHMATNDLPMHTEVKLQTIVRDWSSQERQGQALQLKIRELSSLRLRLSPRLAALADEYRQVLLNYLETRQRSGMFGLGRGSWRRFAAEQAINELNSLDARRAKLAPAPKPQAVEAVYRAPH